MNGILKGFFFIKDILFLYSPGMKKTKKQKNKNKNKK